jgi:hypothetical protein
MGIYNAPFTPAHDRTLLTLEVVGAMRVVTFYEYYTSIDVYLEVINQRLQKPISRNTFNSWIYGKRGDKSPYYEEFVNLYCLAGRLMVYTSSLEAKDRTKSLEKDYGTEIIFSEQLRRAAI